MTARFLPLVPLMTLVLGSASAQSPWIAVSGGMEILHQSIRTNTLGTVSDNHTRPVAAFALQLRVHPVVRPTLEVRSTLGSGTGFRSAKVGFNVTPLPKTGAHFGAGLSRTDYWEGGGCVTATAGSCGGAHHEGRWHFELSAGYDFPLGKGLTLGPAVWFLQPVQRAQLFEYRFRAIGGGFRLGLR